MLKVVHIITGLGDGGAESMLFRLCQSDSDSQHVVVSLRDGGKYGPLLSASGISVHCLDMPKGGGTLSGFKALVKLIRTLRPDVIQTWLYHANLIGGLAARVAGVRNVCWGIHHGNLTPGTMRSSTIFVAKLAGRLSSWVPRRIICCSEVAMATHVEIGYDLSRFSVIPNGYDLMQFVPDARLRDAGRKEIGVDAAVPLLGMVARFDLQKDHGNLLAALGKVKKLGMEFKCLLVGVGMDSNNIWLVEQIAKEKLVDRIVLVGRRSDINGIMNSLDVHVLSSLGEAFPNVLSEAMACGTPCVTTNVGDAAMIVGNTGWIVPPKDPDELARAIVEAIEASRNLPSWRVRQASARNRVEENFSIGKVVAKYRESWLGG